MILIKTYRGEYRLTHPSAMVLTLGFSWQVNANGGHSKEKLDANFKLNSGTILSMDADNLSVKEVADYIHTDTIDFLKKIVESIKDKHSQIKVDGEQFPNLNDAMHETLTDWEKWTTRDYIIDKVLDK